MTEYSIHIGWGQESDDFSFQNFDRTHFWKFSGGTVVDASSLPDNNGNARYVNPVEALIASIASSHMLSFLAQASMGNLHIIKYEDRPIGIVEVEKGKMRLTKVILKPTIVFKDNKIIEKEPLRILHEKADKDNLIVNSVHIEVVVDFWE